MADLVTGIVTIGSNAASVEAVTAGETVTAGDCLYQDVVNNEYLVSDCTVSTKTAVSRIALSGGVDTDPITVMKPGQTIDLGVAIVVGEIYVLSADGKIAPVADLAAADYVTIVGYGATTSLMMFEPNATGYLRA